MAEQSAPRYRVEHRTRDRATLIVGFADTPLVCRSLVAVGVGRALRERTGGELVVVDKETGEETVPAGAGRRRTARAAPRRGA